MLATSESDKQVLYKINSANCPSEVSETLPPAPILIPSLPVIPAPFD